MGGSELTFLQINLHRSYAATSLLGRWLDAKQTDCALIQEPWTLRGIVGAINTKNFYVFQDSTGERPRACVCVARSLQVLELPGFKTRDLVAVKIGLTTREGTENIVVASVYLPYDAPTTPPSEEMIALVEYCKEDRLPIVLGCDANSHHTVWGRGDVNPRGEALLEYIAAAGLEVANKGCTPTFVTSPDRK